MAKKQPTVNKKKYYLLKIKNLDGLIANAISDAQRIVYEGLRKMFIAKLPKKDNPDLLEEQRQQLIIEEQKKEEEAENLRIKEEEKAEKERKILEAKEKEKERIQTLKDKKAELEKQLEEFKEPEEGD